MSDDPYVYPGTQLLRNKLDIRDADALDAAERQLVAQRATEGIPTGDFDLSHLRAIHRHLFQDVYDWAGALRSVEIAKGGHQFIFRHYIETGMADVHRRIVAAEYFKGSTPEAFAIASGPIIGDVNYVHPFREGNGRTQLLYLAQLAQGAGHHLALRQIDAAAWLDGSRRAHAADYAGFSAVIRAALVEIDHPTTRSAKSCDRNHAAGQRNQ